MPSCFKIKINIIIIIKKQVSTVLIIIKAKMDNMNPITIKKTI